MSPWITPQYSKKAVNKAGKLIGRGEASSKDIEHAKKVLSNYRMAHAFPLNAVAQTVRKRALTLEPSAVVAQRRKRLPTIIHKLKRHPHMQVSTMQDLGGCRVIFDNVGNVRDLANVLTSLPRAKNRVTRTYDYLTSDLEGARSGPQATGYRGIHLIYTYGASKAEYHGLKIELQIRTQLQHAWATAIETMDLFEGTELKYGKGNPELSRFFVLVSSLMAVTEGTSKIPGAEGNRRELVEELRDLNTKLNVLNRLRGYALTAEIHKDYGQDMRKVLVLELYRKESKLKVNVHETFREAEDDLMRLEALEDDNIDAVLVDIGRVSQLPEAYPNYYADTRQFDAFVKKQLQESS